MTPGHLIPIEPADAVHRICDDIAAALPDRHSITWLELVAFRHTRTPHDARRLANALRRVLRRDDLARRVEDLLAPRSGVLADLQDGRGRQ